MAWETARAVRIRAEIDIVFAGMISTESPLTFTVPSPLICTSTRLLRISAGRKRGRVTVSPVMETWPVLVISPVSCPLETPAWLAELLLLDLGGHRAGRTRMGRSEPPFVSVMSTAKTSPTLAFLRFGFDEH